MHILAGLIATLSVAAMVVYRLYWISRSPVGESLSDAAGGVQKYLRRRAWDKKRGDPLRDVDDARVAATAMMVALAQCDSPMSEREEALILAQMKARFDVGDTLAAELLAHARWLVRDVTEPENCFLKVRPVILESCGPKERTELVEMMRAVANAGQDRDAQNVIVSRLAHTLAT